MLIRFSVENYRSFKEKQVFSMVAGKHTRHKEHIITLNGKRILKSGIMFGANASGKSNFVKAVNFGKNIALHRITSGRIINRHFRIDKHFVNRPGIFQYDFWSNGHFYSYGFAISYIEAKFVSEWLYVIDGEKEKKIFERDEKGKIVTEIDFTNSENKRRFNIYAEDVVFEKTFLSEIVSHKLDEVIDFAPFFEVKAWFESLIIIFPQTKFKDYRQFMTNDSLASMGKLLKYFDTGIESLHGKEQKVDEALSSYPIELRDDIKNSVLEAFNDKKTKNLSFVEITVDNSRYIFSKNKFNELTVARLMANHGNPTDLFDILDESDGTRRLFDLLPLYKKADQNFIILIDEVDRSFHTRLTVEFINKFFEKTIGISTQLIVTLHDSNVMNLNLLRQDEIWFIERQEDHSSRLYSLNMFKERFDRTVAKEYLLGRYGAVPNFGIDPWDEEGE